MKKIKGSIPKRKKMSLNPLRTQLSVLVNQANEKVKILSDSGTYSRAIENARLSLSKQTSRNQSILFTSALKTRRQIEREFARVQTFLADWTSSVEGAKSESRSLKYLEGKFGKVGEKGWYDPSLNEDSAKKAFELYRRSIERAGGWERAVGLIKGKESLIGYGSENLIMSIYDMIDSGYSDNDVLDFSFEYIENGLAAYEQMAKQQVSDYDYNGVIFDMDSEAKKQWYVKRQKMKRG